MGLLRLVQGGRSPKKRFHRLVVSVDGGNGDELFSG